MEHLGRRFAVRSLLADSSKLASALALCSSPLLADRAQAQEQKPPQAAATADAPEGETGMITVTATRRAELIRDVPVAITSVSTNDQQALGARSLVDLLSTVPGVSYNQLIRPGTGDITIRGVSTGSQSTSNPSVGIYLDDVPIGSTTGAAGGNNAYDQRLLDLGGVEILKGPQGTLYGASSMGGLLKYNTRVPDFKTLSAIAAGEVSGTSSGDVNYSANGNINVPLSDSAAVRAAGFYTYDGGYIDATGPAGGKNVNSGRTVGGRVALGWQPTDKLKVRLSGQIQDADYNGSGAASYRANGEPVAGDLIRTNLVIPEPAGQRLALASLNLDYDLGFATLTSITAYQSSNTRTQTDFNDGALALFPFASRLTSRNTAGLKKTTQELRLVSKSHGTIEWLAGFFFSGENGRGSNNLIANTFPGTGLPDPTPLFDNAGSDSTFREYAGYGTLVWNVTSDIALTGGIRQSFITQREVQRDFGLITQNKVSVVNTSEQPTTYLFAGRWRVTSNSSLYARAASGYRAGGPNASVLDPATGQARGQKGYESDTLWNYEIGYKADLPGGLGSFDLALFQIDWDNLQQTVIVNGISSVGNAGKARIRGAEFAGLIKPFPGFSLRGSASYLDAKLTEDSPGLGGVKDERLPASPRFAGSVNARYEFAPGSKTEPFIAVNVSYTGDRTVSFSRSGGVPNFKLPSYTVVDLNAGVTAFSRVNLGVYVRNLGDSRGLANSNQFLAAFGGPAQVIPIRPRTFGLTASVSY